MVLGISIEYTAESIFNFSCDGDASNLRNAINAVTNVNDMYRTSMGSTALHAAANNSHIDCVRILLDEDIEIECKDFRGFTPLQAASMSGSLECCKLIIEKGAMIEL